IKNILDLSNVLTLSLIDGDYPYSVPLHFGYEEKEGNFVFYMHSALDGKKISLIKENSNAAIEIHNSVEITYGPTPSSTSSLFSSVLGQGKIEIVEDEEEKAKGLGVMMRHITGRDYAFSPLDAKGVAVLKFLPSTLTGKAKKE
ncbi:MAG: pyridoxamine 5'-phosphate oxidase family protein, partial [Candidatus Ornithospirochaeta sp.]